jgi:hypothetical protein
VAGVIAGLGSSDIGNWLFLTSPSSVLDGTNAALFDAQLSSEFFFINLPEIAYFATAVVGIVGSVAITIRRFNRYTA